MYIHLKNVISLILITVLLVSCAKETSSSGNHTNENDSLAFGDIKYKSHALEGNMYLIPSSSNAIPEFDTMKVVNTLYADSINIPERDWKTGFPGLPDRFEWFGIEYTSKFKAVKSGRYRFRLNSDDGSKLYIDDSLLINNDGIHGVQSLTGELDLDTSVHRIKVQYIQGPRWYIALQLFDAPAK